MDTFLRGIMIFHDGSSSDFPPLLTQVAQIPVLRELEYSYTLAMAENLGVAPYKRIHRSYVTNATMRFFEHGPLSFHAPVYIH